MNLIRRPRRDAASYEKMLRRVRQLAAGKTVLEVGTQTGRVAGRIVAGAAHIEAVDPSRAWIAEKKRGNDSTKLHYGVQDASSLAFADESFDLFYCKSGKTNGIGAGEHRDRSQEKTCRPGMLFPL